MDFLTQQFIASVKRLRAQLLTLENRIQSIHDQNERHHQQQQAQQSLPQPVLKVDAEIHEKPDPERDKKSGKKFNNGVQLALAIGTWLAFFAAGVYGYVAIRQWREMISARHQAQGAVDAANRSATIAQKSLDEAHKNFVADQRPYVIVENCEISELGAAQNGPPVAGKAFRVNVNFKNVGKTPALNR
jgi:hypothetical protein